MYLHSTQMVVVDVIIEAFKILFFSLMEEMHIGKNNKIANIKSKSL